MLGFVQIYTKYTTTIETSSFLLFNSLMILDLRHDEYVLAILAQRLANLLDTVRVSNERREDHVDLLLDAEPQVLFVLLGHGRQIDRQAWQVHALLAAQHAAVLDLALDHVAIFE